MVATDWLRGLAFWHVVALAVLWFLMVAILMVATMVLIQRRMGDGMLAIGPLVWAPGCLLLVAPPVILFAVWLLARR